MPTRRRPSLEFIETTRIAMMLPRHHQLFFLVTWTTQKSNPPHIAIVQLSTLVHPRNQRLNRSLSPFHLMLLESKNDNLTFPQTLDRSSTSLRNPLQRQNNYYMPLPQLFRVRIGPQSHAPRAEQVPTHLPSPPPRHPHRDNQMQRQQNREEQHHRLRHSPRINAPHLHTSQ